MNIAYVRVSTEEQNEERQVEGLKKHGIGKWFIEKVSAKTTARPQLQMMLDYAREGDTIYVHDLSRLARSTKDFGNGGAPAGERHRACPTGCAMRFQQARREAESGSGGEQVIL